MIVRELITRLGFDADESKIRSFDGAVQGLQKSLLAVVGAATAAGGAAFALAASSARYGDEVAKTARQIGFSTDALQEYRFAFDRLGVSEGEATSALERFNRRLGQARDGSGQAAGEFEALGISLRDANGEFKSAEDLLPEVADAMAGAEDAAERAAIAQNFFGRSGGALAIALAEGSEVIGDLREEFRLLGGGLTEDQTKAAEEFTDSLTNMRTVLNGLRLQIGAELMPVFRPMIDAITEFMVINREMILTRAEDFFQMLANAMRNIMAVAESVAVAIGNVLSVFDNLEGMERALAIFAALALFLRPVRLFALAIFALLEDFGAWMRGAGPDDSLLALLFGDYDKAMERIKGLTDALGGMETVIRAIIGLALLKWIVGVTLAVNKLAKALGFAGVAKAAAASGAAAGAAWRAAFLAAALRGLAIFGLPLALRGSAREPSDEELAMGQEGERARQKGVERVRDRIFAGEDPDAVVGEYFRDMADHFGEVPQDRQDAFRDRVLRDLYGRDGVLGQTRGLPPPRRPIGTDMIEGIMPPPPNMGVIDLEEIVVPSDKETSKTIDRLLDGLQGMTFDLDLPPDLETMSGDVDNSITNLSLDFAVNQSITVPPGTTAEQLAVIRAETRRTLEREVNRAATSLET